MRLAAYGQCCELTKKFASEPLCSFLFLVAVDLGSEAANLEYRRVVKTPMDLTTLSNRLKDREYYQSVQAWAADFALIFDNAILFNGPSSILGGIAKYYREKLDKHVAQIALPSESSFFATKLLNLYVGLLDVLSRPPPSSQLVASINGINTLGEPFDQPALAVLAKKLNKLMDEESSKELMQLLQKVNEVESEGGVIEVDIGKLTPDEIGILWEFVRKKREK
jgi:hypothetical protein